MLHEADGWRSVGEQACGLVTPGKGLLDRGHVIHTDFEAGDERIVVVIDADEDGPGFALPVDFVLVGCLSVAFRHLHTGFRIPHL